MLCSRIACINFKNLKPQAVFWEGDLNLLVGPNGAGKTNFLEAIRLSCGFGPFRRSVLGDLVLWGEGRAQISASFEGEESLEVTLSIDGRSSLSRDGRRTSASELRCHLPCVAFMPEDLSLVGGSPAVRRRFIDNLCAALNPLYVYRLNEHHRLVRHRTKLLAFKEDDTSAVKVQAPLAAWIWSKRQEAVECLQEEVKWTPELSFPFDVSLHKGGCEGEGDLLEVFWESWKNLRGLEQRGGVPLVGPQRDDLAINVLGRPAKYLSRGHKKRVAISLMIAASRVLEKRLRRSPLLLLDEVASELDEEGRDILFRYLLEAKWQVFAATASGPIQGWPGAVWCVDDGKVSKLSG
ncbi:DNA replication/repair protein RecF [Acetomicrobium sp. S15 = DSM 107314]|uniref:DNA replication/repair protein RecF n=1 Tax=Acetomicrobium sp. S15 = DSM 107314 TaxID=2529858 RepID=UPI0018E100F9|nr:DNA replication and repair protein RecF [Acetomicrobium sp. S15 = DSM 107314]